MKNFSLLLLVILLISFQFANAQNAIPNSGFETWNVNPNYDDPAGWGTINGLTYLLGVRTVTKATGVNVHSGSAAIKLESKTVPFQGVAPGIAATGTINPNTQAIDGGVPYNKRPIALTGWYRYQPSGIDTCSVEAILTKWNTGTNQRQEIGRAEFSQSATVGAYTQFTANFSYSSAVLPDTLVIILLTSSKANNSPNGTILYIDDLAFDMCSNFSLTTSSANATCTASDGSASVANVNGVAPFIYAWSNGASTATANVSPSSYTVTVSDWNGCSVTTSVTVASTSTPINGNTTSNSSDCTSNTGSASVTVVDGTAPYTYLWSNSGTTNSINNLGAGAYQVTFTDANGCSGTASAIVTTPNGPTASTIVVNASCFGDSTGSVALNVVGGTSPITYLWNTGAFTNNISEVPAGSYSVVITDANNCSFMISATVVEPTLLTALHTVTDASSSSSTDGAIAINASGGVGPYQITWNAGNGSNLSPGTYCYTVTDANSCSFSDCATVDAPTSLLNLSNVTIRLFPNPAHEVVVIENLSGADALVVSFFNLEGKLVLSQNLAGIKTILNVSKFNAGIYTYRLHSFNSTHSITGKLVIER